MSNTQQPFLGTVLTGVAMKVGTKALETAIAKGAERVMKRMDVPVDNGAAEMVAEKVAEAVTPQISEKVVTEAIKSDPTLQKAINGEPWYQSIIFWLSSGGGATAAWALVELWFQQPPASMSLWTAALGTFFTSIGVLIRRLQFVPKQG